MAKRFVASYQGSAEYIINGIPYEVRTFADPAAPFRADYWPTILAQVGTVRAKHFPEMTEFPSAAVMAEFPGYQAARVRSENGYQVKYNGSAPAVFLNHLGWYEVQL